MKIIGQEELCMKIDSLTISTFPHTVMLVGEKGSGKHLLCSYIKEKLHIQDIVFNNTISLEELEDIQISAFPVIYVFQELSIKDQNQLLKFLEEPVETAFVILLAEYKDFYLPTIVNRCQVWTLSKYSKEVLRQFSDSVYLDLICECCHTPGQVIQINNLNFEFLYDLVNKVLNKIRVASYGNLFNIVSSLEKQQLDVDIFVRLLRQICRNYIVEEKDDIYYSVYKLIGQLERELSIPHINKVQLLEKYLFQIRGLYDASRT